MPNLADQLMAIFIKDLLHDSAVEIDELLSTQLEKGRGIWCRIPDELQAYVRITFFGMRWEELSTEYYPLSSAYRYISVCPRVVGELLSIGKSAISRGELVASIDEHHVFKELDLTAVALEGMREDRSKNREFIRTLRTPARRATRTQEIFVTGVCSGESADGVVSTRAMEKSFPINITDLFILKADHQKFLFETQYNDASSLFYEWMPEDLRLLNRYATAYDKKYGNNDKPTIDCDALEKLQRSLASELNLKSSRSSKVTAAVNIIRGKREYYPRPPVKPISGEEKVSLLDIANALAKDCWKGTVEETQRSYKTDVEQFNLQIEKTLKNHGVLKPTALSLQLSRFIRFWR